MCSATKYLSVLTLWAVSGFTAQAADLRNSVPQDLEALGMGWDTTLGLQINKCMDRAAALPSPPTTLSKADGYRSFATLNSATDAMYSSSLHLSAGYKGVGQKASGSFDSMDTTTFSNYQSYALMQDDILYTPVSLPSSAFRLKQSIKMMILKDKTWPARFRTMCGDSFITGLTPGGHLRIILKVNASSSTQQNYNKQKLDTLTGAYSADAARLEELKKVTSSLSIEHELKANPMPDILPQSTSLQDTIAVWNNYESQLQNRKHPYYVDVTTQSYMPYILELIRTDASAEVPAWVYMVESGMNDIRMLIGARSDATYILNHPDEFVPQDQTSLSLLESSLAKDISSVQQWGINCIVTSGAKCPEQPKLVQYSRLPGRAGDWVPIVVRGDFDGIAEISTKIGSTYETPGLAQLKGRYIYKGPTTTTEITTSGGAYVLVRNRTTNKTIRYDAPIPSSFPVPPDSDVTYYLRDDYWPDNKPDPLPEYVASGRVGAVYLPSPQ